MLFDGEKSYEDMTNEELLAEYKEAVQNLHLGGRGRAWVAEVEEELLSRLNNA